MHQRGLGHETNAGAASCNTRCSREACTGNTKQQNHGPMGIACHGASIVPRGGLHAFDLDNSANHYASAAVHPQGESYERASKTLDVRGPPFPKLVGRVWTALRLGQAVRPRPPSFFLYTSTLRVRTPLESRALAPATNRPPAIALQREHNKQPREHIRVPHPHRTLTAPSSNHHRTIIEPTPNPHRTLTKPSSRPGPTPPTPAAVPIAPAAAATPLESNANAPVPTAEPP